MFRKVLIANRGEIACRIARTCRRLGLAVATVHSDADARAVHVRAIGESVRLGAAPAAESYLHIERVVQAARRVGADAVHPGYGFLSENPAFALALQAAGIAFIGPRPDTLSDFGDKASAKRLAHAAGVPVIPGASMASADAAVVARLAHEAGFPVLLKAAAGGGGKGIRVVMAPEALDEAIRAAMREGANAFGDPSLLVERYLPAGRHIEVQILGDGQGQVLHLGERECSLQRRHQKVVEEAPALPLPTGLRERLREAALALGRSVRYRALGTVEFLVTGDAFHFLEVNPRLQVEHPVTEAITGLDLVELQVRAAAGLPLGLAQADVAFRGHAIEARVYAEDPDADFLPSTGRLHHLSLPAPDVRVECGVGTGDEITSHYDPMIAKLVVHGEDRAAALAALQAALRGTRVVGVANNLGFVEALMASPVVAQGTPDTGTIDTWLSTESAGRVEPAWLRAAPAIAAAAWFERTRSRDHHPPVGAWAALTHWRLGEPEGYLPARPQWRLGDEVGECDATVGGLPGESAGYQVRLDTARHAVVFEGDAPDGARSVRVDDTQWRLWMGAEADRLWLGDGRHTRVLRVSDARRSTSGAAAAEGATLRAPLTGKVLEVRLAEGDRVAAGQTVLVIESMKMELRVNAAREGVIQGLRARVGDSVERGAVLATVRAPDGARTAGKAP